MTLIALAAVVVLLAAANVVNNRLIPRAYLLASLATTALLLVLLWLSGLTLADAGLGRTGLGRGLRWGLVLVALAAVVGTGLAGVVLCELQRRAGSLAAPMALHWATNALGYLTAFLVVRHLARYSAPSTSTMNRSGPAGLPLSPYA